MTLSANSIRAHREMQTDSTEESYSFVSDGPVADGGKDNKKHKDVISVSQNNSHKKMENSKKSNKDTNQLNSDLENDNLQDNLSQDEKKNKYEKLIRKLQDEGVELSQKQITELQNFAEQNPSRVELLKRYSEFMVANYEMQKSGEEEEIENSNNETKQSNKLVKQKTKEIEEDEEEKNIQNSQMIQSKSQTSSKRSTNHKDLLPASKESLRSNRNDNQIIPSNNENSIVSNNDNVNNQNEIPDIKDLPYCDLSQITGNATIEEVNYNTKIPNVKLVKITKAVYVDDKDYEEDQEDPLHKSKSLKNSNQKHSNKPNQMHQRKEPNKHNRKIKNHRNQSSKQSKHSNKQKKYERKSSNSHSKRRSHLKSRSSKSKLEYSYDSYSYYDYYSDYDDIPLKSSKSRNRLNSINLEKIGSKTIRSSDRRSKSINPRKKDRNNYNQMKDTSNLSEKYDNKEYLSRTVYARNQNKLSKIHRNPDLSITRSASVDFRTNKKDRYNYNSDVIFANQSQRLQQQTKKKTKADPKIDFKKIVEHPEILDDELSTSFFRSVKIRDRLKEKEVNKIWRKNRFTVDPFPELSDSYLSQPSDETIEEESEYSNLDDDGFEGRLDINFFDDKLPELKKIEWKVHSKDILKPDKNIKRCIRSLCIKYDTDTLCNQLKKKHKK